MKAGFRQSCKRLVLLICVVVVTGCSSAVTATGPASPLTASPNQAFVTVLRPEVRLLRSGAEGRNIQPGESDGILPKDHISVENKGRAFLEFPHQVEMELVRGTEIDVTALKLPGPGPLSVRLKQVEGHSFTRLESIQQVQLVVETDYATATPLTDNTQFLVCHAPGVLTCVVAVNGETRVEAQNQAVTLKSGEGTFVIPNQGPRAPFCADLNQVRDWWSQMRGTEDTSDLGSMVVGWLQNPCPTPLPGTGPAPVACVPSVTVLAPASAPPATSRSTRTPTATPSAEPTATATPSAEPNTVEPTLTATAQPSATTNATDTPAVPLPSGDGMVKIDEAGYVVGSSAPDDYHIPSREITLPTFWIDRYPVNNTQYRTFLDNTGHAPPPNWRGGKFPVDHAIHPVVGLTWDDAAAFCAWENKRLPTEAEWEVAGRGPGPQPPLYPWGSDPMAEGKTYDLPQNDTYQVGSIAFNRSSFGVYDMIGTIWQWVGEPYAPVPEGFKILRGGRYGLLEDLAYRQQAASDDQRFTHVAGVRCAADRVTGG